MNENLEAADELREVQRLLREAAEMLRNLVRGTSAEGYAFAYTIPAIEMVIDEEHEWLGGNSGNVQALIEMLEEDAENDEREGDDPTAQQ